MRPAWVLVLAIACHRTDRVAPATPAASPGATVPRLAPPPVLDLDAPDAPYRAAVGLQLQPGWFQFLEDCRLRLPVEHPLNAMTLVTTADISVDAGGKVVAVELSGSGNADFDRAVREVISDAAPLPKPPAALWSDDDRVHLRWLFARDRRQAGPATAALIDVRLPVRDVIARLIKAGELTRAARRILREPAGPQREAATTALLVAGLREALASSDTALKRFALHAIAEAGVGGLAIATHDLIFATSDVDVRIAALRASAALGDHAVVRPLLDALKNDIETDLKLTVSTVDALVSLDAHDDVVAFLRGRVKRPTALTLHALGRVAAEELLGDVAAWQRSADARVRAGACVAITRAKAATATSAIARGLADRDAKVRASCLETVIARMERDTSTSTEARIGSANARRTAALIRDRDDSVRAAAVRAFAAIHAESSHDGAVQAQRAKLPDLAADPSAEVRVAYLRALADLSALRPYDGARDAVLPLLDDRDADVRAAAWDLLVVLLRRPIDRAAADPPPDDLAGLVARAMKDAAPQVRRAALDAVTDDGVLMRLSGGDDDGEVRTRALVRYVNRRGRAASTDLLLGRFAEAAPGSTERVRVALAWHLAR